MKNPKDKNGSEEGKNMRFEREISLLRAWISESKNIVFFGGAGVSTESGIPDFRSEDGLYQKTYSYPPEQIISRSFFERHTDVFYRFYKERMLYPNAAPNAAHISLAKLEKEGTLKAIITQNIDGLHQAAGSSHVLELHGSVHRNHCRRCGKFYGLDAILKMDKEIPTCDCGGVIKPDVVLYEEALDASVLEEAYACIQAADMLIVGGTSLVVYPAAGLVRGYSGNQLVVINQTPTGIDAEADLVIAGKIGEVLERAIF